MYIMAMQRFCNAMHGMKAPLIMVVVQTAFAGINILYKLVANDGMSLHIVVAYRFIFATVFMVPVALIFERKNRPKLTWKVLVQAFFCGLFGGSMGQNLYLESLALTSATYASAMANLVPGMTFILAISFGLEKLRLGTMAGKAKVAGTLMGIGGAMLLTFYKGVEIVLWSTNVNLLKTTTTAGHSAASLAAHQSSDRALGSLLAVCSCLCYALWLIIQAKMSESYPAHYSSTALMSFMGSVQAVAFALCREKDWTQWKLGWNIRLLGVSYAGIIGSGVCITLITWCVRMRGPLFVSIFNPLMLVLVALAGSMVLDEKLHLGSALGAGLIVCGLYMVLWGKGKEMKRLNQLMPSTNSSELPNVVHVIEIVVPSPKISIDPSPKISIDPSKDHIDISGRPSDINVNNTRVSTGDDAQELPGNKVTSQ
ncbi:WAT1-related protein At1g25270-like [Punica granatum]|uniref:WAT1-related protein At1g25270-like n=1 Tax=Punica granatum TaxID=22663 RepID=A0A6P8D004_PUNGR|nr:WAT1-related protein At1g25270-like [Punica granatum]